MKDYTDPSLEAKGDAKFRAEREEDTRGSTSSNPPPATYALSLVPTPSTYLPSRIPETLSQFVGKCLTCHIGMLECDKAMPICTSCSIIRQTEPEHKCTYFEKHVNQERRPDPLPLTIRGPAPRRIHAEISPPIVEKAGSEENVNASQKINRLPSVDAQYVPGKGFSVVIRDHVHSAAIIEQTADGGKMTAYNRDTVMPLQQRRAEDQTAERLQQLAQQTVIVRGQLREDPTVPEAEDLDVDSANQTSFRYAKGEESRPLPSFRRPPGKAGRILIDRRFAFRAGRSQDLEKYAIDVDNPDSEDDTLFDGTSIGDPVNRPRQNDESRSAGTDTCPEDAEL
ncbi:hypothetical protein OHC33_001193 [Knufia fluminis]|uniref:Zn(2)-C6 fungal-type domain-containing protein n=1 Tax=Knufia fluminis TaxID=191047 RepID=A0AAN8F6U2_9EURO|nr:hypothetical protein OHC33_001193 [Knufia fluminis]